MNEKILYCTDHNLKTGFGIVAHNVCIGLADVGYDTYFLGWGFRADDIFQRANYKLIPCGNDPFGADVLPQVLQIIRPEVFIVQADSRMVMFLPNMLRQIPNKPTWIFYPVIDGHVWDVENTNKSWASNWTQCIKAADKVVAMTKYGQEILKANGIEADCIYHGVDTTLFKPVSKEQKEQIKASGGIAGKFVFGGVFKNMQRKNPEKYLQALRILLNSKNLTESEKNNIVLLLHTFPQPTGGGEFDLVQQAVDYGLQPGKNVLFSTMGMPPQQMSLVFQAMDVFLALGGMEGFDLPLAEAQSCGLPLIVSDSSTHPELVENGKCGLIAKSPTYNGKHKVTFGSYNGIECDLPDPYDVAKKMELLYKDSTLREKLGIAASEKACRDYDWAIIRKKWVDLVKSLIVDETKIPEEWARLYAETKV